jgi:hypothetical protein
MTKVVARSFTKVGQGLIEILKPVPFPLLFTHSIRAISYAGRKGVEDYRVMGGCRLGEHTFNEDRRGQVCKRMVGFGMEHDACRSN